MPGEGLDVEVIGCTREIPGGGFIYTNRDTVSIGVVVSLPALTRSGIRPEELIADFKSHPAVAPWLRGASAQGVQRPPDPRGRLQRHAGPGYATGSWLPATPRE